MNSIFVNICNILKSHKVWTVYKHSEICKRNSFVGIYILLRLNFTLKIVLIFLVCETNLEAIEFFTMSNSARSDRSKSELPPSVFMSIKYVLKYAHSIKVQSPWISIKSKIWNAIIPKNCIYICRIWQVYLSWKPIFWWKISFSFNVSSQFRKMRRNYSGTIQALNGTVDENEHVPETQVVNYVNND